MLNDALVRRVCGEFLEMPGMALTPEQAQRLWGLDEQTCQEVLGYLVDAHFLCRTNLQTYTRAFDGPARAPEMHASR